MADPPNSHTDRTFIIKPTKLVITWPDGTQKTFPFIDDIVTIGRGVQNTITVPKEFSSISRDHLQIRRSGSSYLAKDLGSLNGVYVNGSKIESEFTLQDKDEIQIGEKAKGQQILTVIQISADGFSMGLGEQIEIEPEALEGDFQAFPFSSMPYLEIRWPDGNTSFFPMDAPVTLLGRDPEAGLKFPPVLKFISNRHAEIRQVDDGFLITDLNSANGTLLNNQPLSPEVPTRLLDGSIIRIGEERFGNSVGIIFHIPSEDVFKVSGFSPSIIAPTKISEMPKILIGRGDHCDISLPSLQVSRDHAQITQEGQVFWLEDLDSLNGTLLNGQAVSRSSIQDGDLISIGSHLLLFQDGELAHYENRGMRLDVSDLSKDVKTRSGPLRILHNVEMTVLPREFLAIVGGSGAGKTTLINALTGHSPTEGVVKLNGHNFHKEIDHFRSQLGYVPQTDILHTSLTVERALDYTAQLRLPSDTSLQERQKRISEVLETVSMNTETIRNTRISNLSGGQRKRVSIAAELLADPKLIYLDEATSGLDPGLEKKMMYTLRRMADEGRTVIMITHATANIVQTDHVAFISQGRLVYFGPSKDALDFFEVDSFADIYEHIERHGEKWQEVFHQQKPNNHKAYVLDRQRNIPPGREKDLPKIRFGIGDFLRQFNVLTRRTISVLRSEWFTLALMLLLLPLTALLQLIIATPDVLVGDSAILADPVSAAQSLEESYVPFGDLNAFVFVMGLEAVLVGMYLSSTELIKDRSVYLRERMVNLRILPYLFSKIAVFTIFALIQPLLYLLVLSLGVELPEQGLYLWAPLEIFITMFLTTVTAMSIGFVVSAISKTSDVSVYILVLLIFFQFFFAGTVFDLRDNNSKVLSYLTATRWSLTALGVTIDMEEQVEATVLCNNFPNNPAMPGAEPAGLMCFNYPDATEDLMLPYDDELLVQSWVILILMAIVALSVTGLLIKRLDKT